MKSNFVPQSLKNSTHNIGCFLFEFTVKKISQSDVVNIIILTPIFQKLFLFNFENFFDSKVFTRFIRKRFNSLGWGRFFDLYIHNYKTNNSLPSLKI